MKIFTFGLDNINIQHLKDAGYEVVTQNILPDNSQVGKSLLIFTAERVSPNQLSEISTTFPEASLLYWFQSKKLRQLESVYLICESNGIFFLPPRTTTDGFIEKVRYVLEEDVVRRSRLIGFFGSGPGIGCTSIAKTLAKRMALTNKKVILLGLDLYDPGHLESASISLDRLRSRITGRMLYEKDFDGFIKQDGYSYLPGNFDFLSAQDYTEDEIEYLLEECQKHADVVLCDFGSIPESAAWYVGMQRSAIRLIVTHPKHAHRLLDILELAKHMDLQAFDFQLIINRNNISDAVTSRSLALQTGSEVILELSHYEGMPDSLPLGKKELQAVDEKVKALLVSIGLNEQIRKKGGLFS